MTQQSGPAPQPVAGAQPTQRVIAARYVIHGEIGRGGMGVVWHAEDQMIGRQVAIKELHLPDGVPPQERGVFEERVLREARTAGRLNDPGVVTVYDVVQESGTTFIVMELLRAPTLSDVVRGQGPLPQATVAALAEQLLSALRAAHEAGVVHRDVKPSNIMMLPNGRVKLTDFGIAQSVDDPRLTTSGILIGSPTYMAPERIRGQEATAGSDLWALGAVLFFAVEGHSPFERASTAATMHAIMTEVPYLTRCQGPLASVIMGLLIGNPDARLTAPQVRGLLTQVHPAANGPGTGPNAVTVLGTAYPHPGGTVAAPGPHRPTRGGVPRWVAAVLAVVLLAGGFAGGWFADRLAGPDTGTGTEAADGGVLTYGDGGQIPTFNISAGSCGPTPLAVGRSYPSSSSCAEAHDLQVIDTHSVVNSGTEFAYPGADRLGRLGRSWCSLVFASEYVVRADKNQTLTFVTLVPSQRAWEDTSSGSGHREVVCVVHNRDTSRQLDRSLLPED